MAAVILSYLSVTDPDVTHVVACPVGSLSQEVLRLGHRHVVWEATRDPGSQVVSEMRGVRDVVKRTNPDLVHLHSSKAGLAGRLALRGSLPTVFQPHAWSFSAVRGPLRALSARWERLAQQWTHATICVGTDEMTRGRAAGVFRSSFHRSHLLPNAINPSQWPLIDRRVARTRLGLTTDGPLAVCVGRLCHQKGQDLLMAAWPRVTRGIQAEGQEMDAQLVLVGDGPDRAALERSHVPGVRLVGSQDPHLWFAAADLVVVPSRWEGMAMVPLEAQASGRLVVATDVDGMREALHADHIIVPMERPGALAAALIQGLSDRCAADAIGRRARYLTQQAWNVGAHQQQLKEIYLQAVAATSVSNKVIGHN